MGKFGLAGQFIAFGAGELVLLKVNGQAKLLRRHTLAANGKGVVPTVGVEHAGQQRGAQDVAHLRAAHARAQGLALLA